jgi:O-acetyl-ADP-ribose deacetylase (regulator of RNase III)
VGPKWVGGQNNEDELLANCYRNSLTIAVQHDVRTIAFPSISTGIYGFPHNRAARIALRETLAFLKGDTTIEKVIFVCFNPETEVAYTEAVQHLQTAEPSN